MPWKTWAYLEKVSSADFQTYLQNQVVPTFTTTAQRDTQVPTPIPGMLCYISGTKQYMMYGNAAWTALPFWQQPWGLIYDASIGASQAGITTEVDVTSMSVTFQSTQNRVYRITGRAGLNSSVAGDVMALKITDENNAQHAIVRQQIAVANTHMPAIVQVVMRAGGGPQPNPPAGSWTKKLRAARDSGTGTGAITASGSAWTQMLVEDIGCVVSSNVP